MKQERLDEIRNWLMEPEIYEYLLADSVQECLAEIEDLTCELADLEEKFESLRKENKSLTNTLVSEFESFLVWKKHGIS